MKRIKVDPNHPLLPLQFKTRALLRCSMPRRENDLHHLWYDPKRGWECRVTVHGVDRSGKVVTSKRLKWRWGKLSESTAILKRDASIAALEKVGLKVVKRQLVRGVHSGAR